MTFIRPTLLALGLAVAAVGAQAASSCEAQAVEKKLAGAAKTSFIKKCEKDAGAGASCEAKATEKKLAGAARNSFIQKCERDAREAKDAKPKS